MATKKARKSTRKMVAPKKTKKMTRSKAHKSKKAAR